MFILYNLWKYKTMFSDVFGLYRKRILAWNWMKSFLQSSVGLNFCKAYCQMNEFENWGVLYERKNKLGKGAKV